jgi:hypothetical protein
MGMVNPMGWYDERGGTPGPSPIMPPKAIDHALSRDSEVQAPTPETTGQQVWGGTETPGYAWRSAPDGPVTSKGGEATEHGGSALGLFGVNKETRDEDDDPDQVFTSSPENEQLE